MSAPDCDYCTRRAIGVDEDGLCTCGDCTASAGPLPSVAEVSVDDGDDDDGENDDGAQS